MLERVLRHLRNWFETEKHFGVYSINDGTLDAESGTLPPLKDGQYFRIVGSVFNDGVHKQGAANLTDETFDGAIWALAIPKSLLDTVEEITEWQAKNKAALDGPYQSESFGGYSYTLKSGTNGSANWKSVFSDRLNIWRKI